MTVLQPMIVARAGAYRGASAALKVCGPMRFPTQSAGQITVNTKQPRRSQATKKMPFTVVFLVYPTTFETIKETHVAYTTIKGSDLKSVSCADGCLDLGTHRMNPINLPTRRDSGSSHTSSTPRVEMVLGITLVRHRCLYLSPSHRKMKYAKALQAWTIPRSKVSEVSNPNP
jgi:hypothetical protein